MDNPANIYLARTNRIWTIPIPNMRLSIKYYAKIFSLEFIALYSLNKRSGLAAEPQGLPGNINVVKC